MNQFNDILIHYNHNHDKLGRFAKSNGTSGGVSNGAKKKIDKDLTNASLLKQNSNPLSKDGTIRSIFNINQTKHIKTKNNRHELRDKWTADLAEKEQTSKEKTIFLKSVKAAREYEKQIDAKWNEKNKNKYKDKFGADYEEYKKDITSYRNSDKKLQQLRSDMVKAEDNWYRAINDRQRQYAIDHVEQFVDATIKDLNLENNEETRSYIRNNYDPDWVTKSYEVLNSKREKKLRKSNK